METENLIKKLNASDFHIDSKGRMVLKNSELMKEINGAAGIFKPETCNGQCANAYCP